MENFNLLKAICIVGILGLSNVGYAAQIVSAELDSSGKNILIDVVHGGGCGEHDYSLKLNGCAESMPVQCQADLVHKTDDFCEALLHRTAVINLEAAGIKGEYYSGGSLTINGSNGSKATVILPSSLATSPGSPAVTPPRSRVRVPQISCTTHTGSKLEVFEMDRIVTLLTKQGESHTYGIRSTDELVLESLPEVYRTSYRLTDGRTVVIEFQGENSLGTGYFVRLNGQTSPRFPSCEQLF